LMYDHYLIEDVSQEECALMEVHCRAIFSNLIRELQTLIPLGDELLRSLGASHAFYRPRLGATQFGL